VNLIYYDICQKILGEYSEKNKYHSQLLYLLCYIGNVRKVTDIDKIVTVLRMLKDLYKLCLAYYVVIGEKDETFKKVGSQNQQKFGEVRKLPKARKTGACIEMRIRENIYSCIRNRIIRFETKMNDQSGNSTN